MIRKFNEYYVNKLFKKIDLDGDIKLEPLITLDDSILNNLYKIFNKPEYQLYIEVKYLHPFEMQNECNYIKIYWWNNIEGELFCIKDEYFVYKPHTEGSYYLIDGYDGLKEAHRCKLI